MRSISDVVTVNVYMMSNAAHHLMVTVYILFDSILRSSRWISQRRRKKMKMSFLLKIELLRQDFYTINIFLHYYQSVIFNVVFELLWNWWILPNTLPKNRCCFVIEYTLFIHFVSFDYGKIVIKHYTSHRF